jgi:glycosyltransferase involved in cell wall biosynthesis
MANGSPRVHFIRFQNQSAMPTVYRLADLFVLPSLRGETWGLAVNEAMASGRPVVVSDRVGCARDLVSGQNTGATYRAAEGAGLAQALSQVLDDAPRRKAMGITAQCVIQRWSLSIQAERMEEAVTRVVDRRGSQ